MSRAIASARQRRAGISNPEPPVANQQQQQQQQQQQSNGSGLTLPQVIALVDTRLIRLETFMKETQQQKGENHDNSIFEEYNNRFTILADEIANIKDIVLRLQSYTMEVNKTLLENQNIVNPETDQSLFVFQTTDEDDNNMNMGDIYDSGNEDDTLLMENIE